MVSAEAMQRKFYAAPKRAVVGDGGNWIEPLGQLHFAGWLQILDFLHLLVHLFAAARLAYGKDAPAAWKLYEQMLRQAWGGKVQAVLDLLQAQVSRLRTEASASPEAGRVVELALAYVERNRERMDYPRYRQMGLPVSSSLVESLIKQINQRVKGTEQFWNHGGLEAVLQVRAAYLSEDGRAEEFHQRRPRGPAVGCHRAEFRQRSEYAQPRSYTPQRLSLLLLSASLLRLQAMGTDIDFRNPLLWAMILGGSSASRSTSSPMGWWPFSAATTPSASAAG